MVLSSDFKLVITAILIFGLLSCLNKGMPIKNSGAVSKSTSSVSKKTISKFTDETLSSLGSLETYGSKKPVTTESTKTSKTTKSSKKAMTPKVVKKVAKVSKKVVKKDANTHNVKDYLPKNTAKSKKFGHTSFQHHKLPHKNLLPKIKSINTVGNQMKYATLDMRGLGKHYINPQTVVSPWMNTTASPDLMRRPLC